jgi:hypothetical protein
MSRAHLQAGGLTVIAAAAALALAGCGGSKAPSVASVATTTTTGPATHTHALGGAADSGSPSQSQIEADTLKYSQCMRASGVPGFPDPNASGSIEITPGTGIDPRSPAFQAARAKCQKLLPGGLGNPGSATHPSPDWLAQMEQAAQCMRRHGIANFPDPQTTVPSLGSSPEEINDIDGVIFVFPASIDTQSPQFTRAATACGFPLHNH